MVLGDVLWGSGHVVAERNGRVSELGIGGVFFDLDISYSKSPYLVKPWCVDSRSESIEIC